LTVQKIIYVLQLLRLVSVLETGLFFIFINYIKTFYTIKMQVLFIFFQIPFYLKIPQNVVCIKEKNILKKEVYLSIHIIFGMLLFFIMKL